MARFLKSFLPERLARFGFERRYARSLCEDSHPIRVGYTERSTCRNRLDRDGSRYPLNFAADSTKGDQAVAVMEEYLAFVDCQCERGNFGFVFPPDLSRGGIDYLYNSIRVVRFPSPEGVGPFDFGIPGGFTAKTYRFFSGRTQYE